MSQLKLLMYGLLQGAEQKSSNWIISLDTGYLHIIYLYIFEEKLDEIEHGCCFIMYVGVLFSSTCFINGLTVVNGNYFFKKNTKFFLQEKIIYKCECIYAYMYAMT